MNLKETYIHRIIHIYVTHRFSYPIAKAVGYWLTDGKDTEIKNEALMEEWQKCSSVEADKAEVDAAFARYQSEPHEPTTN